jgi:hypothetical protein
LDKIFISHAGTDTDSAHKVAHSLAAAGLVPVLDRKEIGVGDSFLTFMEEALRECNYCLLLWSLAASQRKWVQVEWEAALYRSVTEARAFLVVGRLESHQVPALLAPRNMVDLFPELRPGLDKIISTWREDAEAGEETGRLVSYPVTKVEEDEGGETVYVTSELFGRTMPIRLLLDEPVGMHLDRIVNMMKLPRKLEHEGRIGCHMNYKLAHKSNPLAPDASLREQGVGAGRVLWLEVDVVPFSATAPVKGGLSSAVFRDVTPGELPELDFRDLARGKLMAAVKRVGMAD